MNEISGVYQILNIKNNKSYVGSSISIYKRWNQHKRNLNKGLHHSYKLQRDWKEFGEDNFKLEILEEVNNIDILKDLEQNWINTLNSFVNGYNVLEFTDYEKQKSDIEKWNEENDGFVFSLFLYNKELYGDMNITKQDIFKLFYIASFIDYDNYLVYNNAFMKKIDLNNLLNITRSSFDIFFNKLKIQGVILEDKYKNIKFSEEYFSKGIIQKNIKQYKDFTRIYIKNIRYLYENNRTQKHSQLGAFLKLIPYVHRETNVVCNNQTCKNDNIIKLDIKMIKDILEYSRNSIKGLIEYLLFVTLDDGSSIIKHCERNKSHIIINPKVFYGGNFKLVNGKNEIIKWF